VLEAAGTKWNFLKFKPGLVGGHCIGVDPYYLTHKAEMLGYHPQVILAGRRINDGMGKFIAEQTIKHMIAGGSYVKGAKVNVLGLTFKENCGDLRNSKVIDIINELKSYGVEVFVTDPQAEPRGHARIRRALLAWDELPRADAIVAAVAHQGIRGAVHGGLGKKLVKGGAFIDVKAAFDAKAILDAGYKLWRCRRQAIHAVGAFAALRAWAGSGSGMRRRPARWCARDVTASTPAGWRTASST
jgi:UDP-N-acetyl-D-galactosamine dehydrogenase